MGGCVSIFRTSPGHFGHISNSEGELRKQVNKKNSLVQPLILNHMNQLLLPYFQLSSKVFLLIVVVPSSSEKVVLLCEASSDRLGLRRGETYYETSTVLSFIFVVTQSSSCLFRLLQFTIHPVDSS